MATMLVDQSLALQTPLKILVVDDDRRIVKTMCDILRIKGYLPIAAFTGEEGVEKVKN
jgi:two-component system response regulator HydG